MAELRDLEWDEQETFWQAITVIEAQEALVQMDVANFPWVKGEDREKIHKRYHKLAYPKIHNPSEVISTEEAVKKLNEVLNVQ